MTTSTQEPVRADFGSIKAAMRRPCMHAIAAAVRKLVEGAHPHRWESALIGSLAVAASPVAWSAPEGGSVSAGQAQIVRIGNLTNITQQSSRAVVDWRSFSVSANEAVNYQQISTSAVTLNRVLGGDLSTILGHITANGSVFLVNPNGVVFGEGARVDVGGLVASATNISNANFMAGNYRFDAPGKADAKVENRGTIRVADAGIAALVGRQVSNSGFILANLGKVALVGGDAFVLDLAGDRLVSLVLDPNALEQIVDGQGRPLIARVDNTGSIMAGGGRVELSAALVSRLLDNVINVQGDVRATAVNSRNGVVSLTGGDTTDVLLGGVMQAAGPGGRVEAAGRDITIASGAQIDMGTGADVLLNAARNIDIDAAVNALREGSIAGGRFTATAGASIEITKSIALNDGALTLTASTGTLKATSGTVLQAGTQSISLHGAGGVEVDRVLTHGKVDIASSAGAVIATNAITAPSTGPNALPVASLNVQAGEGVTLHGTLATGNIDIVGAGNVALDDAAIESRAGHVTVQSGGTLNVYAAAASGDIALTSGGAMIASHVLGGIDGHASASITVDAGGPITLAGAHAGLGGIRITGHGDVLSQGTDGGLVSAGGVTVTAVNGHAGSADVPLHIKADGEAGAAGIDGGARIEGQAGVEVAALVTPGAVLLRSDGGSVTVLSAIAGSESTDLSHAVPTRELRIEAAGDVSLAGATAGAGGVVVAGPDDHPGAGSFVLSGGSLLSDGDVTIATTGSIMVDSLVQANGNMEMTASAGSLTVGSAGMKATGAGYSIELTAGGDLILNGDLHVDSGLIALASTDGAVTALVTTPGADPVDADALVDAGNSRASHVSVSAELNVTLSGIKAAGSIDVRSDSGNVQLLAPLGGASTGYLYYDNGYRAALRPDVGTLTVTAPAGSVELNGLNLDGLADPHAAGNGLSVTAGHMILGNATIAVNKGAIVLQGGSTLSTDGVYLGNNVFSRGWDSVGSDGVRGGTGLAADEKVGYDIGISGRNLGLFDSTIDVAELPGMFVVRLTDGTTVWTDSGAYAVNENGVRLSPNQRVITDGIATARLVDAIDADDGVTLLGQPIPRTVAKVEIANNVANYQDADTDLRDRLVPITEISKLPRVVVSTEFVGGVQNAIPTGDGGLAGRQALPGFSPVMGALSEAPVSVTPAQDAAPKVASTRGIVLKMLGFEAPTDLGTEVWNTRVAFSRAPDNPDPNQLYGANAVFAWVFSAGDLNTPGSMAVPHGGTFKLVVEGTFTRGVEQCEDCIATYTLQRQPGTLSGFAKVMAIDIPLKGGQWVPDDPQGRVTPETAIGKMLQIRFNGAAIFSDPGRTDSISLTGKLLAQSGSSYGGDLSINGDISPSGPLDVILPKYQQSESGSIEGLVPLAEPNPRGYLVGRVIADSSTSGIYVNAPGSRVEAFDGILDSLVGRAQTDSTGGRNYIPGSDGIGGKNNSTTGFASVNASLGAVYGGSSSVGVGGGGGALPPNPGEGYGSEFVSAPIATPDSGFIFDLPQTDRSAQDALGTNQATQDNPPSQDAANGVALAVEIGLGPAAQADLGRSGGVVGSATNVFKRAYRIASAAAAVVCVPEVIEPLSPGAAPPVVERDCKPTGR